MSTSESATFASKPFTFIVQGKPLYVHAVLISECSKPLDRMMNGDLSEAKQGFALLEDVDEATFVRFIRWTYNKDYPAPEHTIVDTGDKEETEPAANTGASGQPAVINDMDDAWAEWGSIRKKDKKKKKEKVEIPKGNLKEAFINQGNAAFWGPNWYMSSRCNKGPQEDYTEVFLSHARMYVFAEKYDIQKLQTIALLKLQHTLGIYTLYPERVGDITSLLKYVYANTAETKDEAEDIRTMLAHYVGTEMPTLLKDGEIKDLMLDDGEMLGDFLKMFALKVS